MNTSALTFGQQIEKLRLAAAVIYDRARGVGEKPEAIQKIIQPVTTQLDDATKKAVKHDLGGVIMAIKSLESAAEIHERDAKFLIGKAMDARNHAMSLRTAIGADLKEKGVTERSGGGFSVTLTEDLMPGGKKQEKLTLR